MTIIILSAAIPIFSNSVEAQVPNTNVRTNPTVSGLLSCDFTDPLIPDPPGSWPHNLVFSAQGEDGEVSIGSWQILPARFFGSGQITGGTVTANLFTLTGTGGGSCTVGAEPLQVTISGTCGDNAQVTFKMLNTFAVLKGEFTGSVTCIAASTNNPPTATDDTATTTSPDPVRIDVLINDIDRDGDRLTVTGATDPAGGTAVVNQDNTITYTPDQGFSGPDTFDYTISDNRGGTDTGTVRINVQEEDADGDGASDSIDNCRDVYNPDQADADRDGIGDACDPLTDSDGDNVADDRDNCPLVANSDQTDTDGDGTGDACDNDRDDDGVNNNADNCPLAANPDQADFDNDGIGDVCDDETSLTVFKNQGQCIAFVNNNPEDAETLGITKEKCQRNFNSNN